MMAFERLERLVAEADVGSWDPDRPARAVVVRDDGSAGLRFETLRRDGTWALAHEEPAVALADDAAVDDLVARALSTFLMKHPTWPR